VRTPTSRSSIEAGLAGRRVLVVEDELLTAMEMEHILGELGCEIVGPAPSVQRALALLDRERPDLAVLDVQLGAERAAPIAERLEALGIPFVLVTGYGRLEPKEPVLRRAPRLSKPVEERAIAQALARAIRGPGSAG
jgi:CheY-like chemotaxis protein